MSNRTVNPVRLPFAIAAAGLLLVTVPAGRLAAGQAPKAIAETEDAVKLIQADRLQEAMQALDRAVAADHEYWQAYYQRGRVLGKLGRWEESRDALLRAVELNPGHGHSHHLAALAAAELEDWEVAWDQAIKAYLAGQDMMLTLYNWSQEMPLPSDFDIRINAATVFVAPIDTSTAAADVELPTNFNPNAPSIPGQRQGRPANQEDSAISQSSLDLVRIQRAMRGAVAESPRLAVVLDPGQARYILSMQLTEISTSQPNRGTGYIRLIDVGEQTVVHRQPIELPNLGSMADIAGRLRRYVTDLTARLAERDER